MTTTKNLIVKAQPLDSVLTHIEVIALSGDGKWRSPSGGWLDGTVGIWLQKPEGLMLYLGAKVVEPPAGRILGLAFKIATQPLSGTFDFTKPQVANGTWTLDQII